MSMLQMGSVSMSGHSISTRKKTIGRSMTLLSRRNIQGILPYKMWFSRQKDALSNSNHNVAISEVFARLPSNTALQSDRFAREIIGFLKVGSGALAAAERQSVRRHSNP